MPAPRDESPRGLERFGRVRGAARARLLERRDERARHCPVRTRGGTDGAHDVVEAHEPDGVALAKKEERERRREPLGVRELGEARAAAPLHAIERLTSSTIVARRLVSSSYCFTTQRSARAAIFQST